MTLDIAADVATDAANNGNTAAATQSVTVADITTPDPVTTRSSVNIVDTTRPNVEIEVNSLLQKEAFSLTITFSEAVSDFVQADLSLTPNTARATVTAWTASEDGTTYTATITPTNSGVVTLYVAPNVADDGADNGNTQLPLNILSL